jgi:hypothetical protein
LGVGVTCHQANDRKADKSQPIHMRNLSRWTPGAWSTAASDHPRGA